jgi:hypothetical protein
VLQSLVAHEAVVAQTSRAQQKAKEAAAAVDAVSSAAQQLGAVDTTTNQTLGSLTAAAAALNTIATSKDGAGSANGQGPNSKPQLPSMWDLKGRIEQHKQKVSVVGRVAVHGLAHGVLMLTLLLHWLLPRRTWRGVICSQFRPAQQHGCVVCMRVRHWAILRASGLFC